MVSKHLDELQRRSWENSSRGSGSKAGRRSRGLLVEVDQIRHLASGAVPGRSLMLKIPTFVKLSSILDLVKRSDGSDTIS